MAKGFIGVQQAHNRKDLKQGTTSVGDDVYVRKKIDA